MRVLEFSNNGIIDSLTHAPAPAVFLNNLSREYANAMREDRSLSILSLRPCVVGVITELQLLAMSKKIVHLLRHGEFFSRISEDGYWIAVRGDSTAAQVLGERIVLVSSIKTPIEGCWTARVIECPLGSPLGTFDEWIQACDTAHFGTL